MNFRFLTTIPLIAGSAIFITGCGDNSSFETPNSLDGTNQIAAADDIKTQAPDRDSFSIASKARAVEALEYEGNTSDVSIYVADRNNNPVPDNTPIRFETSWGQVDAQCLTTDGKCTVTWTEAGSNELLPASFEAIILAYTNGEESFTDLNDNDLYDSGEPFTDISEPFFDINGDTIRNANTEEFIDANNNNIFDNADGLFTGTPCVGDNTVCNRVSTLIWDTTGIQLSSHKATNITIASGTLPTTVDTTATLTISITDINYSSMADGTTVAITSTGGSVDPASINLAAGQTLINITYTTGSTSGNETLTIEVTSAPSGFVTIKSFSTTIP